MPVSVLLRAIQHVDLKLQKALLLHFCWSGTSLIYTATKAVHCYIIMPPTKPVPPLYHILSLLICVDEHPCHVRSLKCATLTLQLHYKAVALAAGFSHRPPHHYQNCYWKKLYQVRNRHGHAQNSLRFHWNRMKGLGTYRGQTYIHSFLYYIDYTT